MRTSTFFRLGRYEAARICRCVFSKKSNIESFVGVFGFSIVGLLLSCLALMVPIDGPSVAIDRLLLVLVSAPIAALTGFALESTE